MDNLCLPLLVLCLFCLAYKHLLCHLGDFIRTVFVEDDDIVEVATVANKLVFLQTRSDKAIRAVDVEFLIGFCYGRSLNRVEIAYFSQTRMFLSVFLLEESEPVGCDFHQIVQVAGNIFQLLLNFCNQFVGFVLIKFQDTLHLDFQQTEQVITNHLAHKVFLEGFQSLVDILEGSISAFCILERFAFIDTFLDEDFLE